MRLEGATNPEHKAEFYDEFLGKQLSDPWQLTLAGTGTGAVVAGVTGGVGVYRLSTFAADDAEINWNNIYSLLASKNLIGEAKI